MDFIAERIKETEQTADRARAIALRQENRDDVVEMQKAVQDLVQDLQALEQDFRRILQEQP
jgi:DNA-binding ferritin-like protein